MRKLIFLTVCVLFVAINTFGQEQTRINPLSEHQDINKFNQENHHLGMLKEGFDNQKRLDSVVTYGFSTEYDSVIFSKDHFL